ncbi:slipin family protein [Candidatus Parcubacteria bacterium]|nr:MAG: slipin family protein [Candidatus Parcubacteria bacterium]
MGYYLLILIIVVLVLASIRQINEYERGVKFMLGRYYKVLLPGWRLVFPLIQSVSKVDMRVRVIDVPDQDAITKDNVSVNVNAVLYYKVADAKMAIIEVEEYAFAVSQLAQTTMRDVVGEVNLDELLASRDVISSRIQQIVDKASDPWGIKVVSVDLKHIELPEEMKRTIAKQAEAEREKRAVIIKAEGEVIAAVNMAKAAKMLSDSTGALHLRTLQSINDISSDQSNTVVFVLPIEILRALEGFSKK